MVNQDWHIITDALIADLDHYRGASNTTATRAQIARLIDRRIQELMMEGTIRHGSAEVRVNSDQEVEVSLNIQPTPALDFITLDLQFHPEITAEQIITLYRELER